MIDASLGWFVVLPIEMWSLIAVQLLPVIIGSSNSSNIGCQQNILSQRGNVSLISCDHWPMEWWNVFLKNKKNNNIIIGAVWNAVYHTSFSHNYFHSLDTKSFWNNDDDDDENKCVQRRFVLIATCIMWVIGHWTAENQFFEPIVNFWLVL